MSPSRKKLKRRTASAASRRSELDTLATSFIIRRSQNWLYSIKRHVSEGFCGRTLRAQGWSRCIPFCFCAGRVGVKLFGKRELLWSCLTFISLIGCGCWLPVTRGDPPEKSVRAQSPGAGNQRPSRLKFSRKIAGDSKKLEMYADQVTTWKEANLRIVLLKGLVLIRQGTLTVRCPQAAAVLDLSRRKSTGIYHVLLYTDGGTELETPGQARQALQAVGEVATRGEIKLKSQRGKVALEPARGDALYANARSALRPLIVGTAWDRSPQPSPGVAEEASATAPAPPPPPAPGIGAPRPRTIPPLSPPSPRGSSEPQTQPPPATSGGGFVAPPPTPIPGGTVGPAPTPIPGGSSSPPLPPPPGGGSARGEGNGPATAEGGTILPLPSGGGSSQPSLLRYVLAPRVGSTFEARSFTRDDGEQVTVVTGGVVVQVSGLSDGSEIDVEADNVVIWSRGNQVGPAPENAPPTRPGEKTTRQLELYFQGRVVIRQGGTLGAQTLRAAEIYYDANRNVALANEADLEVIREDLRYPIHVRAQELRKLSQTQYQVFEAQLFSSKLPSDPGLTVCVADAFVEEVVSPMTSLFGNQVIDPETGKPVFVRQFLTTGHDAVLRAEGVPVFYTPYFQGDAADPLGPLEAINLGGNRIFGAQIGAKLNVYDLFGIFPRPGTRWTADINYLSRRGPSFATDFAYNQASIFGVPAKVAGQVNAWIIYDTADDILGRTNIFTHPDVRGRFRWLQNVQDLPDGFVVQSQLAYLSDRNVYEQYYKNYFDTDIDQNNFLYVKQQKDNWAWTALVEPRVRDWVTRTENYPRLDGYLIGESLFDVLTYNGQATAGYHRLRLSEDPFLQVSSTDQQSDSARLDIYQELSAPFYLGPVKLAPYGILDMTYYSSDLNNTGNGRAYGAGGLRASMPLSKIYGDVESLFLNVNGLNHKVVLGSNYYLAGSSDSFLSFAQYDRLNDDTTNRALREINPIQPTINPAVGNLLVGSRLYNPQQYAIRRLVDNRIDTRDDIQVLQLDVRQRLQTKRGFPGRQHIVDWMTLDVSTSIFPAKERDNFGESLAFIEYDYVWNIGDRTALVSTGWFDPVENGARVYTIGAHLNRPDGTNFFLGYRQIDPLQSRAVSAVLQYFFSEKYALTVSSVYDFGISESLSNLFMLTRVGTDLQVSVGVTYNALQSNFGVAIQILPNLAAGRSRVGRGLGIASLGGNDSGGILP